LGVVEKVEKERDGGRAYVYIELLGLSFTVASEGALSRGRKKWQRKEERLYKRNSRCTEEEGIAEGTPALLVPGL